MLKCYYLLNKYNNQLKQNLNTIKEMAQWEANILHEITVIGNDQNIDGTTTISEVNLVICDCNATETGKFCIFCNIFCNIIHIMRQKLLKTFQKQHIAKVFMKQSLVQQQQRCHGGRF